MFQFSVLIKPNFIRFHTDYDSIYYKDYLYYSSFHDLDFGVRIPELVDGYRSPVQSIPGAQILLPRFSEKSHATVEVQVQIVSVSVGINLMN